MKKLILIPTLFALFSALPAFALTNAEMAKIQAETMKQYDTVTTGPKSGEIKANAQAQVKAGVSADQIMNNEMAKFKAGAVASGNVSQEDADYVTNELNNPTSEKDKQINAMVQAKMQEQMKSQGMQNLQIPTQGPTGQKTTKSFSSWVKCLFNKKACAAKVDVTTTTTVR